MITQPARLTIWRWLQAITSLLAWLSLREAFLLAGKLGLAPLASKTWIILLGVLVMLGLILLGTLLASLFTPLVFERWLNRFVSISSKLSRSGWAGYLFLLVALSIYPLVMFQPYYGDLLAGQAGIRLFIFWLTALAGAFSLRIALPRQSIAALLLVTILSQAVIQRILLYLPDISAYPFAMGWSETSRFYYPALFISQSIFGQTLAWPILHPSLHFLLLPPYLIDAPLWFHRFWQVALRFLLVGLIAPALIYRLNIPARAPRRWLIAAWIFLILFTLPLYLHLAVPVIIMLWGFSARNDRRTWFWLAVASIWAGLSRINWYPVPGMLAAALYFLEVPVENKRWNYLAKPAAWFISGTLLAFVSMQVYIALSGLTSPADFYTSLSSNLLWDRIWPNASYSLGVLPGILIFSLPLWLVLFFAWREPSSRSDFRPYLLLVELLVLFAGGIVVSMKIGGGADIHNMDAYAVLLLVISTYLLFGARQSVAAFTPVNLHWSIIALLVLVPAWFSVRSTASFWQYDPLKSRETLAALQDKVNAVDAAKGEILFINQRHLISMHILTGVTLVPEYEREELMEMAMAQNEAYLKTFRSDLEQHRFAAIVVDPLRFNLVGEQDAMGAENNAWARFVVKKILCSYRQESIFPADRVAIYVPQDGEQVCP